MVAKHRGPGPLFLRNSVGGLVPAVPALCALASVGAASAVDPGTWGSARDTDTCTRPDRGIRSSKLRVLLLAFLQLQHHDSFLNKKKVEGLLIMKMAPWEGIWKIRLAKVCIVDRKQHATPRGHSEKGDSCKGRHSSPSINGTLK